MGYKIKFPTGNRVVFTWDISSIPSTNIMCVYKITFNDGRFYIGSTRKLRVRLNSWRRDVKVGWVNKKIRFLVKDFSRVKVDVLEKIYDIQSLKIRETVYLQSNIGNPLLLNRQYDAISGGFKKTKLESEKHNQVIESNRSRPSKSKGIKHSKEWVAKMTKSVAKTNGRGVDQLTMDGKKIASFKTAVEASNITGVYYKGITKCLYNIYKSAGGYKWQFNEPSKMKHIIEREKAKLKS